MAAFIVQSSWNQSALAKRLGVGTRTLKKCLDELGAQGVRVERFEESAREIVWSVPNGWIPGGARLTERDALDCVRLLGRLPPNEARDRILKALSGPAAIARARLDGEAAADVLARVEDAVREQRALRILYDSANTSLRWRTVSPHHVAHGGRPRFVATCHERRALGWFRVDRVVRAEPADAGSPPWRAPADEVATFVSTSASGFHRGDPVRCRMWIRAAEARWARGVLPVEGAIVREVTDGVEIEVETAGVEVLARFVVGLGEAARALTPELGERAREIAAAAVRASAAAPLDGSVDEEPGLRKAAPPAAAPGSAGTGGS
jgi:predicted DNA-binding transcriptional regulator YafY